MYPVVGFFHVVAVTFIIGFISFSCHKQKAYVLVSSDGYGCKGSMEWGHRERFRGIEEGLMVDQEKVERRIAVADRRSSKMDRRQFIDIGWPIEKERRVAPANRRQRSEDRRG